MFFFFSFLCGCPAVPLLLVKNTILSLLNCLDMPVDNQLAINVEIYFRLCSSPPMYVFILFHFQTLISVALEWA